jgi:hypothetical protein
MLFTSILVEAFPTGIGQMADRGCLCHGGESSEVIITVQGFPEIYNASQRYNITFSINASINRAEEDSGRMGGFRLLIDGGQVEFEDEAQYLEEGWTHTNSSNEQRGWNLSWVAPQRADELVSISVFVNAVNGGDASSGDKWGLVELVVIGPNWTDAIPESSSQQELSMPEIAIAIGAVSALLGLLVVVSKD